MSTGSRSRARSRYHTLPRRVRRARRSRRACRARVDRVVSTLFRADRPRRADIVRVGRRARCSCPCGWYGRSGAPAGGRRRRSRARRAAGRTSATPESRPTNAGRARTTNRTERARGRRRSRSSEVTSPCRSPASDASPTSTVTVAAEELLRPRRARRRDPPGPRRPCGGALPARSRSDRSRPDLELPAPRPVGRERPTPPIAPERLQRLLPPVRSPGALTRTAPASVSCPSLTTVA